MNNQCGIYLLTHTTSGKIYVGQSINIKRRWWSHGAGTKKSCPKLHNAISKYGKPSFVCTILELTDKSQLTEREQHYLDTLKPFGTRGYNISTVATPGVYNCDKKKTGKLASGESNCRNKSVCQYDSAGNLLNTYYSIKAAAGDVNINYMGITNCINGRARTAGGFFWALEGTTPTIRQCRTRLGQHHTEETKQKISQSNFGHTGMIGSSNKSSKPTFVQSGDCTSMLFLTIRDAAKYINCSHYTIGRRCSTEIKQTINGYKVWFK